MAETSSKRKGGSSTETGDVNPEGDIATSENSPTKPVVSGSEDSDPDSDTASPSKHASGSSGKSRSKKLSAKEGSDEGSPVSGTESELITESGDLTEASTTDSESVVGDESSHQKHASKPAKSKGSGGSSDASGPDAAAETGGIGASSDPQMKDKSPKKSTSKNKGSRKGKGLDTDGKTPEDDPLSAENESSLDNSPTPEEEGAGAGGETYKDDVATEEMTSNPEETGEKQAKGKFGKGRSFWDKLSGKNKDPNAVTSKKGGGGAFSGVGIRIRMPSLQKRRRGGVFSGRVRIQMP